MALTVDYNLLLHVARWPAGLVAAIQDMADEIGSKPLRPPEAKKLITTHIEPLTPDIHPGRRIPGIYPSWDDFRAIGRGIEMLAESHLERCVGSLLIHIPEWCAFGNGNQRKPRVYCDLCWKHALSDRKFCFDHTQENNAAEYRKGKRLRETFYSALHSLKNYEHGSKCNQDWDKVINGDLPLSSWLSSHRPKTFSFLRNPEDLTFSDLLSKLDYPDPELESGDEPVSFQTAREKLHASLLQDANQLFGMLRRCEAWRIARESRPCGGKRRNAGRKPRTARLSISIVF